MTLNSLLSHPRCHLDAGELLKVTINTFVDTEDKIRTGKKEKKVLIESRNNKAKRFCRWHSMVAESWGLNRPE